MEFQVGDVVKHYAMVSTMVIKEKAPSPEYNGFMIGPINGEAFLWTLDETPRCFVLISR